MSHTPTPWTWAKWNDEPTPCIIGPEGDERICEMNGNEDGFANAELIVKAVNSYQAMKEALEKVMKELRHIRDTDYEKWADIITPGMMNAWDQCKEALTLANGEDKEP